MLTDKRQKRRLRPSTRVWFVDWELSALAHPFYDLAVLSTFLSLPDAVSRNLLNKLGDAKVSVDEFQLFLSLRKLAAIGYGATFLSLIAELDQMPACDRHSVSTLANVSGKWAQESWMLKLRRENGCRPCPFAFGDRERKTVQEILGHKHRAITGFRYDISLSRLTAVMPSITGIWTSIKTTS